jgi:hypothetical protein
MFRMIVVSYLVIASAVGPSLCCCATTSTILCVRSWFGIGPIVCAGGTACSHSHSESGHSHQYATHHGSYHGHSKLSLHEVESQGANSSVTEKPGDRTRKQAPQRPCPCKQDGNERPALASSIVAGKSVLPTDGVERVTINWSLGVCMDEQTTGENPAVHHFRTDRLNGREILRALHILRC